jgi:hypothetical protein
MLITLAPTSIEERIWVLTKAFNLRIDWKIIAISSLFELLAHTALTVFFAIFEEINLWNASKIRNI